MHSGADGDRELPFAFRTAVKPWAVRLAVQSLDFCLVEISAMRTERAIRPASAFQPFSGLIDVMKSGIAEFHYLVLFPKAG